MADRLHVYRLGFMHSKWIVVLSSKANGEIEHDLPLIKERLKELHDRPILHFDHIEYLGSE